MSGADYIVTLAIAVIGGVALGPPAGYWTLHWQHRVSVHRAHCAVCKCDAARRAERQAARRG